jgi:putative Holliday junction resolvase
MTRSCIWLGFDHGAARIGVAVGQSLTGTARPLTTVRATGNGPDWNGIDRLIQEWQPTSLIVGLPLHNDGAESNSSKAARAFAAQLSARYQLDVHLHDERLSSQAAEQLFAEARSQQRVRASKAKQMDAMAAAVILESWLADQ